MYFALDQAIGATGFRIFKDMLNRTFYRRISKGHTTKLDHDIIATSTTIQVVDGTIEATNKYLMPSIITQSTSTFDVTPDPTMTILDNFNSGDDS